MMEKIQWFRTTVRVFKNWPSIYSRKLFGGQGEWRLALRQGPVITVADKGTALPVVVEVWDEKVYGNLDYLASAEHPTIIDIGANLGSFSLLILHLYPNARVFSFEPEPTNADLLTRNIADNGYGSRAKVFRSAVGATSDPVTLYRTGQNTGTNSMYTKTGDPISVPCTTLDALFRDNEITACDLLKIDCEGAEYDILFTASDETFGKIKHIVLEWHDVDGRSVGELKDYLVAKGYELSESATRRLISARRM